MSEAQSISLMYMWCSVLVIMGYKNLQFPDGSEVTPMLFWEAEISSFEIAFLKAVMLPPEIARFCAADFFKYEASLMSSANQHRRIRNKSFVVLSRT